MQQNEADILAINKIDRLTPTELDAAIRLVKQHFPKATPIPISASTGEGIATLRRYRRPRTETGYASERNSAPPPPGLPQVAQNNVLC